MYNLIGVVCTSHGDQKYIDTLRDMWRGIRDDAVPEMSKERVKYKDDVPTIPWKQATHLMFKQLAIMKRLNGG